MHRRKSSLYYAATLTESGQEAVLAQLSTLSDKWVDEFDVYMQLCVAASKFVAGELDTIQTAIDAPLTRSGKTEYVLLNIHDFVVYDTEPDEHVVVHFPRP